MPASTTRRPYRHSHDKTLARAAKWARVAKDERQKRQLWKDKCINLRKWVAAQRSPERAALLRRLLRVAPSGDRGDLLAMIRFFDTTEPIDKAKELSCE